MKTLTFVFSFLLACSSSLDAQAPSYTDFEWDIIGFGVAAPLGEKQLSTGISTGGEVRYNLTDNVSLGIGSDFSFFDVKNFENIEDEDISIGFSSTSYIVGDYYFSADSPNRAFAGLAIGGSQIGDIEITQDADDATAIEGEAGMSIVPRIGYELGHARFLLHYNIGLEKNLSNYVSLKVSLTLWGGYNASTGGN